LRSNTSGTRNEAEDAEEATDSSVQFSAYFDLQFPSFQFDLFDSDNQTGNNLAGPFHSLLDLTAVFHHTLTVARMLISECYRSRDRDRMLYEDREAKYQLNVKGWLSRKESENGRVERVYRQHLVDESNIHQA
jgi:hypothetical protein